jgi:hypothetical protein
MVDLFSYRDDLGNEACTECWDKYGDGCFPLPDDLSDDDAVFERRERVEYAVFHRGARCVVIDGLGTASAYIEGGVAAGNRRDDYHVRVRKVVILETPWAVLPR